MKIIETNNKITCPCGCVFEYDSNDVKREYYIEYHFFSADEMFENYYVMCPICKRKHTIRTEFHHYC